MTKKHSLRDALNAAFPHTIPIFTGFLFLGMSYGVLMKTAGFPAWFPLLTSTTVFAGSMEYVTVDLLQHAFNPLQAFLMTLMINARHLFYGLSMLDRYKNTGLKKIYLIFGMCDESFSINYAVTVPPHVDRGWFMFFVTLLNQSYWVLGATLGGIFGTFIRFNTEGLDFVMTAMFTVILLEQWLKEKRHTATLLGLGLSAVCLLIFGAERFLLPAMLAILAALTFLRKPLEKEADAT